MSFQFDVPFSLKEAKNKLEDIGLDVVPINEEQNNKESLLEKMNWYLKDYAVFLRKEMMFELNPIDFIIDKSKFELTEKFIRDRASYLEYGHPGAKMIAERDLREFSIVNGEQYNAYTDLIIKSIKLKAKDYKDIVALSVESIGHIVTNEIDGSLEEAAKIKQDLDILVAKANSSLVGKVEKLLD